MEKACIYQVTNSLMDLMMSYVIRTKNGKIIVIDGGYLGEDITFFMDILKEASGSDTPTIDAWFLTHMHEDHMTAVAMLMERFGKDVTVKKMYFNFPDRKFMSRVEGGNSYYVYDPFEKAYDSIFGPDSLHAANAKTCFAGDKIVLDDNCVMDVLLVMCPEQTENNINDTSSVFRLTIDGQTILFLGDSYVNAGQRLLDKYGKELKSDIVQMAHHGQSGVRLDVYEAIAPKMCLWPTPTWVYDNRHGNLQTLEVRSWIHDMGIEYNTVTGVHGTVCYSLPIDFDKIDKYDVAVPTANS